MHFDIFATDQFCICVSGFFSQYIGGLHDLLKYEKSVKLQKCEERSDVGVIAVRIRFRGALCATSSPQKRSTTKTVIPRYNRSFMPE